MIIDLIGHYYWSIITQQNLGTSKERGTYLTRNLVTRYFLHLRPFHILQHLCKFLLAQDFTSGCDLLGESSYVCFDQCKIQTSKPSQINLSKTSKILYFELATNPQILDSPLPSLQVRALIIFVIVTQEERFHPPP